MQAHAFLFDLVLHVPLRCQKSMLPCDPLCIPGCVKNVWQTCMATPIFFKVYIFVQVLFFFGLFRFLVLRFGSFCTHCKRNSLCLSSGIKLIHFLLQSLWHGGSMGRFSLLRFCCFFELFNPQVIPPF